MSDFTSLIDQTIHVVPSFTLESGRTLLDVPVAYKTWGTLNETRDNVMVICHAFTGSADVEDWWGPLMGRGKAFDPSRFFIFCANVMGSPYGSASPVTVNPETGRPYGPEFPLTTIRDDVLLHKLVLDTLDVRSVAVVIGGSMGGMAVLEWPLCTPPDYVKRIIPIATSARHSAWCISWGETQRQSIYSDPTYDDGYYVQQPSSGLAAARMAALLTYRSRDSFENRFGRKPQKVQVVAKENGGTEVGIITPPQSPVSQADEAFATHNDGHRNARSRTPRVMSPSPTSPPHPSPPALAASSSNPSNASTDSASTLSPAARPIFSAQSYLRYQGDKFVARFDANCYIAITRKLDTHDVSRGRSPRCGVDESRALADVLAREPPRALVIGIKTDGLFTIGEQREIRDHIPGAVLVEIFSPDGHDGFLLEFEQINSHILTFLKSEFAEYWKGSGDGQDVDGQAEDEVPEHGFEVKKTSMFGEAEVDITRW